MIRCPAKEYCGILLLAKPCPGDLRVRMMVRNRTIPRFGLLTAFMVLAAACTLSALNAIARLDTVEPFGEDEGSYPNVLTLAEYGWPWTCRTELANRVGTGSDDYTRVFWPALGLNIAVGMGISLAVAVSTEVLIRALRRNASNKAPICQNSGR
jgi:hypothetical protein